MPEIKQEGKLMRLNNDEFVTDASERTFDITIKQESNWSTDGGYTFEDVTNTFTLSYAEAWALIDELKLFVNA